MPKREFRVAKIPAMICMNLSTQASISDFSLRVHWKNNLEVSEHLLLMKHFSELHFDRESVT